MNILHEIALRTNCSFFPITAQLFLALNTSLNYTDVLQDLQNFLLYLLHICLCSCYIKATDLRAELSAVLFCSKQSVSAHLQIDIHYVWTALAYRLEIHSTYDGISTDSEERFFMFSCCNLVSFKDRGIDSIGSCCKNFVKFGRRKQVYSSLFFLCVSMR